MGTGTLTFGSSLCCLVSCLWPVGFGFISDATGASVTGLKYCLYFTDILHGLFSIHCQLHLASVHGPKDEIQSEPFQDTPPGENWHAASAEYQDLTVGLCWGLGGAYISSKPHHKDFEGPSAPWLYELMYLAY